MQVLERPGNLLTLVIKFSLKTIVYSIILDFYFVRVSCFSIIIVHLGNLEKSI